MAQHASQSWSRLSADDFAEASLINRGGSTATCEAPTRFQMFKATVILRIWKQIIFHSLFALCVVVLHDKTQLRTIFSMDPVLPTIVGVLIGFSISLRTTTSYGRWWEARCLFASTTHALRFLAQLIWVNVPLVVEKDKQPNEEVRRSLVAEKRGVLDLLEGYAYVLKHHLRMEPGFDYDDTRHLLAMHLAPSQPNYGTLDQESNNSARKSDKKMKEGPNHDQYINHEDDVPAQIILKLSLYIAGLDQLGVMNSPFITQMLNQINALDDQLSSLVRILTTPIPYAYSAHLDHIVTIYLLLLPFQLCQKLGWFTVIALATCSFFFLGFISIGKEVIQPYGHDANDLPLDSYCRKVSIDIGRIRQCSPEFMTGSRSITTRPSGLMSE